MDRTISVLGAFDLYRWVLGMIPDINMAEREGFEPSEELPPHTISNRAD